MLTKKEIVAGTVTGLLGNIAYAVIAWLLKPDKVISFKEFLSIPIPLWYVLLIILLIFSVLFIVTIQKKKPVFLNHTEEKFKDLTFQWRWAYDKEKQKYFMKDLTPLCPACGNPLDINTVYNAYCCTNGHSYSFDHLYAIRKDLLHKLKQQYKEDAGIIHFPDEWN